VALFFYLYAKYNIMKLIINQSILRGGKRYNEGDKIELPDNIAKNWIAKGFASKVRKKQNKENFETKELKIESIESKDDATN